MPDAEGRRQRRLTQRQRQILDAATRVFSERGYDRATTKEIAAAAELSEGSLYNYFPNKRAILKGVVDTILPDFLEQALGQGGQGDAQARLTDGMERMVTYCCDHRDRLNVLVSEVWRDKEIVREWLTEAGQRFIARMEALLREMMAEGSLRPLNTLLAARMVLFVGLGVALPVVRGLWALESAAERRALAVIITDLLLHGLASPAALDNPKGD